MVAAEYPTVAATASEVGGRAVPAASASVIAEDDANVDAEPELILAKVSTTALSMLSEIPNGEYVVRNTLDHSEPVVGRVLDRALQRLH